MILTWPSGRPLDRLAHGELGVGVNDGGAAFGLRQHDGVRLRRRDGIEVGVGEAGCEPVDPHEEIGPRCGRDGPP